MSIAATVTALENFSANDDALLNLLLAQLDTELAELDSTRARLEARKEAIKQEFSIRRTDLKIIVEGNA